MPDLSAYDQMILVSGNYLKSDERTYNCIRGRHATFSPVAWEGLHPRLQNLRKGCQRAAKDWLKQADCGKCDSGRGRPEGVSASSSKGTVHESYKLQVSIVTSVPIGVYGQISADAARGSSTHPRLCGVPNEARSKLCSASPPLK